MDENVAWYVENQLPHLIVTYVPNILTTKSSMIVIMLGRITDLVSID